MKKVLHQNLIHHEHFTAVTQTVGHVAFGKKENRGM